MSTPNSTSPGIGESVSPVVSVVQAGSFAPNLSDDQVNLQLMNNHVIKALVENFAGEHNLYTRTIAGLTEGARRDIATTQMYLDNGVTPPERGADNMIDQRNARGIANSRAQIAALEVELENGIFAELQRVNGAVYEIATKILNARNPTAQGIRNQITAVDAQITGLAEQARALGAVIEQYEVENPTLTDANRTRIAALISDLDRTGVPPTTTHIFGAPGGPQYETWAAYFEAQVINPANRYTGLSVVRTKLTEIKAQMDDLADQYPAPYKQYQKLLSGFSVSEQRIDWWKIGTKVLWVLGTEAAWIAAGIIVAPITGGIGTAVIASARMANRAGMAGRLVGKTINGVVIVATWYARLEDRIASAVFQFFARAWARVRGRTIAPRGQTGGEVQGDPDLPNSPSCAIGACAIPG